MNQIRIGKKVVGFVCVRSEPYPWGDSECFPILGPTERLPEDCAIQEQPIQERINEAVKEIKETQWGLNVNS